MRELDLSKIIFYFLLIVVSGLLIFLAGIYSGRNNTLPYRVFADIKKQIDLVINEASTITKTHPKQFLQVAIHEGDGVTINTTHRQQDLIMLSGFFDNNNEIRLIRRDGEIVASWPLLYSKIFAAEERLKEGPNNDWNVDTHGALVMPDGAVVFNFENAGMVKMDRCGKVVWKLNHPTHHSVEVAEGGGYWVGGMVKIKIDDDNPYPPFNLPVNINTILKVSDQGEIIKEISIPGLFYKNDIVPVLTATGGGFRIRTQSRASLHNLWGHEIIHANKIEELTSDLADDFPQFDTGDLLLSLRGRNMLLIVDPDTEEIKWWKVGPWIRQHDPEFVAGGKISVFNNNIYVNVFMPGGDQINKNTPRISNIIEIDPLSLKHRIVYGDKPGQQMLSVIRGKHEVLPYGGLLITEFEGGRAFETNPQGEIVWQYINRYNNNEVAEITEARLYSKDYFTVKNWSCSLQ